MFNKSVVLFILVLLSGCASVPPEKQDPRDPLQSINRPVYDFNMDILDTYILRPAAVGYLHIPQPVRSSMVNFTTNIGAPTDAINAALQGKTADTGVSIARFLVNSTVGLFGLFDVASELGLKEVDEDFGQTLGKWGVGNGPYLMLPAMGPSTARNTTGLVVDKVVLPEIALGTPETIGLFILRALEARASLISQERLLKDAIDPYIFVKDVYLQRQLYELYDGNPPLEEPKEEFNDDFLDDL